MVKNTMFIRVFVCVNSQEIVNSSFRISKHRKASKSVRWWMWHAAHTGHKSFLESMCLMWSLTFHPRMRFSSISNVYRVAYIHHPSVRLPLPNCRLLVIVCYTTFNILYGETNVYVVFDGMRPMANVSDHIILVETYWIVVHQK